MGKVQTNLDICVLNISLLVLFYYGCLVVIIGIVSIL